MNLTLPAVHETLEYLLRNNLLNTSPEPEFDQLTEMAADICGVPFSLITFIDNDNGWVKSQYGSCIANIPKDCLFFKQVAKQQNLFEVNDSRENSLFIHSQFRLKNADIVYFAGAPLILPSGEYIGALCVMDENPLQLTDKQKRHLAWLANQVIQLLTLRKIKIEQQNAAHDTSTLTANIEQQHKQFQHFVYAVSHDLKAPLVTIAGFSKTLEKTLSAHLSDKQKHRFNRIHQNVSKMSGLLSDLVTLSRIMNNAIKREKLDSNTMINDLWHSLTNQYRELETDFFIDSFSGSIWADKAHFTQCVVSLLENAITYRSQSRPLKIKVQTQQNETQTIIRFSDNGLGIKPENHERIFQVFEQIDDAKGNGIGLCLVKAIMEQHHGKITLQSVYGEGSQFELQFPNHLLANNQ